MAFRATTVFIEVRLLNLGSIAIYPLALLCLTILGQIL